MRYEKFTVGAAELLFVVERKLGDLDCRDFGYCALIFEGASVCYV